MSDDDEDTGCADDRGPFAAFGTDELNSAARRIFNSNSISAASARAKALEEAEGIVREHFGHKGRGDACARSMAKALRALAALKAKP